MIKNVMYIFNESNSSKLNHMFKYVFLLQNKYLYYLFYKENALKFKPSNLIRWSNINIWLYTIQIIVNINEKETSHA
jgi:hypothetical protein